MGNQLLKKVIGEQREKITKLEAKIDVANKILEPKIDAQQHLINSGSNMAVYALYFSKQELIDLKASLSQEPMTGCKDLVAVGTKLALEKGKTSFANEKSIR